MPNHRGVTAVSYAMIQRRETLAYALKRSAFMQVDFVTERPSSTGLMSGFSEHPKETAMNRYSVAVLILFNSLHDLRVRRNNGDLDAADTLIDFFEAYAEADLTRREMDVLYLRFERGLDKKEVARVMGVALRSVDRYRQRAIQKIAEVIARKAD